MEKILPPTTLQPLIFTEQFDLATQTVLLGEVIRQVGDLLLITSDKRLLNAPIDSSCVVCSSPINTPYAAACPACQATRNNHYVRHTELSFVPYTGRPGAERPQLAPNEKRIKFENNVLELMLTIPLAEQDEKQCVTIQTARDTAVTITGPVDSEHSSRNQLTVVIRAKAVDGTEAAAYKMYREQFLLHVEHAANELMIRTEATVPTSLAANVSPLETRADENNTSFLRVARCSLDLPMSTDAVIRGASRVDLANSRGAVTVEQSCEELVLENVGVVHASDVGNITVSRAQELKTSAVNGIGKISGVRVAELGDVTGILDVINCGALTAGALANSGTIERVQKVQVNEVGGLYNFITCEIRVNTVSGRVLVTNASGTIDNVTGLVRGKNSSPALQIAKVEGRVE